MEIDHLLLDNKVLLKEVTKILCGLVLDKETLARVRTVFKQEMALGLQYGLEKVDIKNPAKFSLNIDDFPVQCPNGDDIRDTTSGRVRDWKISCFGSWQHQL